MSESKLIIPAIGKVLAKVETTPGTKVALADADAVFFEEIEWQYASDNIQRMPLAPERHGVKSVEGPRRITWSGSTEMALPDAYDSSADVPHPDVWIQACGFQREDFDSVSLEASFYALASTNHKAISFEAYEFTADGADADYIQARGARCDWQLSMVDGERVKLTLSNGLATEASDEDETYQASSSESKAVTYYTDKPFVVNRGNTSAELVDISNPASPVVFGGGSQGSPAGNFQIISATFSGNMEPEEQRGLGLQRNRLAGSGPVTGTIVIEEGLLTNASAFDPYALRNTGAALEWRCKVDQDDTSGNDTFFASHAYLQIVGVNHTDAGKRRVWELEVEVKYPEDATDNTPAVGASPTQPFDYHDGTRGLYADLAVTNVGVFGICFHRTV